MEHDGMEMVRRRPRSFFVRARRIIALLFIRMGSALWHSVGRDMQTVVIQWRLFFGMTFTLVGLLSFSSSMYCDGNTSPYAGCTRPSTYYFYPWWAIVLVVVGVWLVALWYLRKG